MTRATWRMAVCGSALALACTPAPYEWPDSGAVEPPHDSGSGTYGTCRDADGDGYMGTGDCSNVSPALLDCDDTRAEIRPIADEVCDGVDNNCNGSIDEGLPVYEYYEDKDGDGFGAGVAQSSCLTAIAGKVRQGGDCDDTDVNVHPGAAEYCNGRDDDCNGQVDDNVVSRDYFTDNVGDGYGTGAATASCKQSVPGKAPKSGDCNDADPAIHPGATEVCNNKDDNCDGQTDETFANKGAGCVTGEQGVCSVGWKQCVSGFEQCVHVTPPSSEVCDGLDNSCNGQVDETFPQKGTACTVGLGVCLRSGLFACGADGGLACPVDAGAPTLMACDGLDNDCNGAVDEYAMGSTWTVSATFDPSAVDLAPVYLTPTSCNGGGATGTDNWFAYAAAYVSAGKVYVQQLGEEGDAGTAAPTLVSATNSGYLDVGIAQGGPGVLVAAQMYTDQIDLYYVGPGPTLRTLSGYERWVQTQLSSGTLTNVRVVRGYGGRAIVLWQQTDSGGTKIWMSSLSFTGAGAAWVPVFSIAPTALAISDPNLNGPFAAASSVAEFGDSVGCPTGLAKFAVAYKTGETLKLAVFNEDGTAASGGTTLYAGTANDSVHEMDVAWGGLTGGSDRWAAAFSVAWTTPVSAGLFFWQTNGGGAALFGTSHAGTGTDSVQMPQVSARPTEFLVSALVSESAVLAEEPQAWVGKMAFTGTAALPLTAATAYSGCPGAGCTGGTRRLLLNASSSGGPRKTAGFVLYGGSAGGVSATDLSCN